MTKETGLSCTKGEVYSYETENYKMIIFNNGSGAQTHDLTLDPARPYWCDEVAYASFEDVEKGVEPPTPGSEGAVPAEAPIQGRKVLMEGQLLVEREGSYYDMFGKKVQ